MSENEYLLKICIIGSPQELKTTFIRRFAEGKFETPYLPTLAVDITTKKIQIDNNQVKLILVDTAGQEFFDKLRPSYYRGASAVIIAFDKGDRKSFEVVGNWIKEFREHTPDERVPIGFLGFITETEEVTTEEGQSLAIQINTRYYESHTKVFTPEGVNIFEDLTKAVLFKPIIRAIDISETGLSPLIHSSHLDAKKLSLFQYWGEKAVGYCHFQCDLIPKSFLESYENFDRKFIKFPEHHIPQCVNSCPLFHLIVDRLLTQKIIEVITE